MVIIISGYHPLHKFVWGLNELMQIHSFFFNKHLLCSRVGDRL